jgi:ketosteroid isomerase-like protein
MKTLTRFALAALFLSCFHSAAPAERPADAALQKVLQSQMDYAYGTVLPTGDWKRFANALIDERFVATGSDGTAVQSGPKDLQSVAEGIYKTYSSVKAKSVWTRSLGPDAACQFVLFELTLRDRAAKPNPVVAKSLFVWVKTAQGWRIAADHYSLVGMDTP